MSNIQEQTRNTAYHSIDNLPKQRQTVMEAIRLLDPCTERDVADHLGITINRVTGRFNELSNWYALIKPIGTEKRELDGKINDHVLWTEITDESEREAIIFQKITELRAEIGVREDDLKTGMSRMSLEVLQKVVTRKKEHLRRLEKAKKELGH